MRVTSIPRITESISISEYVFGAAQRQITYPGLAQCISVTKFSGGLLRGTHISPGSSPDEVKEHFRLLNAGSVGQYSDWYVIGQFQEHFRTANAVMGNMSSLRQTLRKRLGKGNTFYTFDTSALTASENWAFGIDIRATQQNYKLEFSFAKAFGRPDKPFSKLSDWYFTKI
ncbi:hypothetical protein SV7mr_52080 [Stieleria bergensis]|uniref:Uncharacterized protein n=1 Tax=Stieleria bergensis TaxID=2528025 RepID=A0A517T2Q3_9BACT|nr:hypothetical protein SV7mr_52080 [Planctomycetes bacterium SV_7m_r]